MSEGSSEIVLYEARDGIARVTMNRPAQANAQNSAMTYALDAAFRRAVDDDAVKVIVLAGAGRHFSGGHDIGTPGEDAGQSFQRQHLWWDHADKAGAERLYVREQEVYLGMCRRWKEIPKPTIAQVHGACIAGGLMLAWVCDLIVASEDAFFQDPVLRMGVPGVEYFAHCHELNPRLAREFLFLGERMPAARAAAMGMVNKVVPREQLGAAVDDWAHRIAAQPRMGLMLAKQAVNRAEDFMGLRATMDCSFGLHHLAHSHNQLQGGSAIGGQDLQSMARANRGDTHHPAPEDAGPR